VSVALTVRISAMPRESSSEDVSTFIVVRRMRIVTSTVVDSRSGELVAVAVGGGDARGRR